MTRFNQGPAHGQTLNLRRAPLFLRVAELRGRFRPLDTAEDQLNRDEILHIYRRDDYSTGIPCFNHWPDPPCTEMLAWRAGWQAWCRIHEFTPLPQAGRAQRLMERDMA